MNCPCPLCNLPKICIIILHQEKIYAKNRNFFCVSVLTLIRTFGIILLKLKIGKTGTMSKRTDIKKLAKGFQKKYNVKKLDCATMKSIMQEQGFTVIEYNKTLSDDNVFTIVTALNLREQIELSNGFTYTDSNYRLVFIHEELSEEEKLIVLAHEEGHIYCEHFGHSPIIGFDVADEFEANEFAHYILNPSPMSKLTAFLRRNLIFIVIAALLTAILAGCTVLKNAKKKEDSYYGEYYISSTGGKYHIFDCPYIKNNKTAERLTKEDYYSGIYTPCHSCLSDEAAK